MSDAMAGCAHLNIVYAPVTCDGKNIRGEVVPNGAQYARWECQDCKSEFGPLSTLRTALAHAEEQIAEKDKEIERLKADVASREQIVREQWWRNHGCGNSGYGDDGEMQCCMRDFKRAPFEELKQWVWATRIKNAEKKISAHLEMKARAEAAEAKIAELEAQRQPQSVSEEQLQKENDGLADALSWALDFVFQYVAQPLPPLYHAARLLLKTRTTLGETKSAFKEEL